MSYALKIVSRAASATGAFRSGLRGSQSYRRALLPAVAGRTVVAGTALLVVRLMGRGDPAVLARAGVPAPPRQQAQPDDADAGARPPHPFGGGCAVQPLHVLARGHDH